jgi:hypothetical protein
MRAPNGRWWSARRRCCSGDTIAELARNAGINAAGWRQRSRGGMQKLHMARIACLQRAAPPTTAFTPTPRSIPPLPKSRDRFTRCVSSRETWVHLLACATDEHARVLDGVG